MPTYEYRCTDCGRSVEVVHPIAGTGPETCEACGGVMRKAVSAPAIVFKGSGWAKKDARSASAPSAAGTSDGPSDGANAPSGEVKAPPSADASTKEAGPAPAKASGSTSSGATKPSGGAATSGSADRPA